MIFQTKYNFKNTFSKSGTGIIPVFMSWYDKNGKLKVVPKMIKDEKGNKIQEVDNVYAKIQASADSVNIDTIIKKFTATGDPSILKTNPGAFIDLTQFPDNPIDAINQINLAKANFDRLPVDIKANFDNDYVKFLAASTGEDFLAKLGYKDLNKDGKVSAEEAMAQKVESKKEGE